MRILITGVTGFAGGHLAETLLAQGQGDLFGLARRTQWPPQWQHLAGRVVLRGCDLCDVESVEAMMRDLKPDQIYHLAGYAHTGRPFWDSEVVWNSNLTATRRLYEVVSRSGKRPRILYVGSGLVYGEPETPGQAHDESAPLRPASPYAASKAAADLASYQFTCDPGLDIVRARPFNHIGPRQSPRYAVAHFAQQIADIELGTQPPVLETGNLGSMRDLTDVRDMVQAYIRLMEGGQTGAVYNLGTGQAHSMQTVLDRLLAMARVPIEVRQKPGLVRTTETAVVRADASKAHRELGWQPQFTLEQTLADILAYWRLSPVLSA